MKAKLIFEIQNFTKGLNSKDALGIRDIAYKREVFEELLEWISDLGIKGAILNNWQYEEYKNIMAVFYMDSMKDYDLTFEPGKNLWNYTISEESKNSRGGPKEIFKNSDIIQVKKFIKDLLKKYKEKKIKSYEKLVKTTQNKISEVKKELIKIKSHKISENLNFQRGLNTKTSLRLGNSRPFKDGDKIQIIEPIYVYWEDGYNEYTQATRGKDARFMSLGDLEDEGLTPSSPNVYTREDDENEMIYDEEAKGFRTAVNFTGITDLQKFFEKHPESFERL